MNPESPISKFLKVDNNKALILMIFGGFAFATMGALTHALGKRTDWILIAFFRMFFTFLFVTSLLLRSRKFPFVFNRPLLWFRSLVGSAAMLATFYTLTKLPISDVSVITETRPIWVALLAGIILGEDTKSKIWLAIVLSLIGVLLIEQPFFSQRNFDVFYVLLASVLGAVVMICLRLLRDIETMKIVAHFSGTASIASLLFLIFLKRESISSLNLDTVTVLMLLGVGLFGTFGQLAMTKAFAIGEASTVASAGFIKVGFAAVYDLLVWSYVFKFSTIAGMILILGSTTLLFNTPFQKISNKLRESL
ncbi:MAG: DMT family transporter [Thermodesulfobacteriota bacterium]